MDFHGNAVGNRAARASETNLVSEKRRGLPHNVYASFALRAPCADVTVKRTGRCVVTFDAASC